MFGSNVAYVISLRAGGTRSVGLRTLDHLKAELAAVPGAVVAWLRAVSALRPKTIPASKIARSLLRLCKRTGGPNIPPPVEQKREHMMRRRLTSSCKLSIYAVESYDAALRRLGLDALSLASIEAAADWARDVGAVCGNLAFFCKAGEIRDVLGRKWKRNRGRAKGP